MKIKKSLLVASILIFVIALGMIGTGVYGLSGRSNAGTFETLNKMRAYSVMSAAVRPIMDKMVKDASDAAYDYAKDNGMSRSQRSTYVAEQEAAARVDAARYLERFYTLDSPGLAAAITALDEKLEAYYAALSRDEQAFLLSKQDAAPAIEEAAEPAAAEAIPVSVDAVRPVIDDLTGFVPSADARALEQEAIPYLDALLVEVSLLDPLLTPELIASSSRQIMEAVRSKGDSFESIYDRSVHNGAVSVLKQDDVFRMKLLRGAENMLYVGFGLLVLGLAVLFYKQAAQKLGMPRFVILMFFVLLLVLAGLYNIALPGMVSNVLQRLGMYGVLVLAMLPGIQSGISLNLGMPIGIISGLLSTLIAMENNMTGWPAFVFAVILAVILAIPVGWGYGLLLNRLKGSEMTVSTYVGFSYVSLFCIAWMVLPFRNPKLTWALGTGLRTMHNMGSSFGGLLDNLLRFRVFGISVPTGLLLFLMICCLAMYLYERSKTGVAMLAAGGNPAFAAASGINVDKMRVIGTTLSTVIAAVGIIVYSQSFGFMQLYTGPQQMGFIAASAILIGGATVSKAKVYHVILGTFLFQGVLAMGIQVANAMIDVGGLSEVMRILISNGIILYALTQAGGKGRE